MVNTTKRMSAKEYRQKPKKQKYGSKKLELDGHVFDSKLEARYYTQLKWLDQAGEILFFRLQPRYMLQEAFKKDGKKVRKVEFVGDFEIHHIDGSIEVIDVKGPPPTETAKLKYKLFNKIYPHKLSVVGHTKETGFIEYEKLQKMRNEAKKGR